MYLRIAWEFIAGLFVRNASVHSKSFGALSLEQKKQEFLQECKRPDWSDQDAESAKGEIERALDSTDVYLFSLLPKHYFYLIDDARLAASIADYTSILAKLNAESLRRAGK